MELNVQRDASLSIEEVDFLNKPFKESLCGRHMQRHRFGDVAPNTTGDHAGLVLKPTLIS